MDYSKGQRLSRLDRQTDVDCSFGFTIFKAKIGWFRAESAQAAGVGPDF